MNLSVNCSTRYEIGRFFNILFIGFASHLFILRILSATVTTVALEIISHLTFDYLIGIDDASLWDSTTICSNVCTRHTISAGTDATGNVPHFTLEHVLILC
jgi:hypothetical protein